MRSRRTTAPTRAIAKLRRSDPTASHQSGQEADAPATGISQRDDTRWSWGVRALAAEVVFEADDVLELGRRNFDEGAAFDRLVAVAAADRDARALARPQLALLDRASVALEGQVEPALDDSDPLVLPLVVLERQALAGLEDEDLADVLVGPGPDDLVAPGLGDVARQGCPVGREISHGTDQPRTSCSPAFRSASRRSAEVASV